MGLQDTWLHQLSFASSSKVLLLNSTFYFYYEESAISSFKCYIVLIKGMCAKGFTAVRNAGYWSFLLTASGSKKIKYIYQFTRITAYPVFHCWNALNSTDWWDLTVQEYPRVEFIFKASGANRSVEASWSSWVGVKRYSIKRAERFFPLQKALLLHHGYQSLIFDFSWPFSIKNMIATVRVTDPGRGSTTLTHTLTHPTGRYVPCLLECAGRTVPFT